MVSSTNAWLKVIKDSLGRRGADVGVASSWLRFEQFHMIIISIIRASSPRIPCRHGGVLLLGCKTLSFSPETSNGEIVIILIVHPGSQRLWILLTHSFFSLFQQILQSLAAELTKGKRDREMSACALYAFCEDWKPAKSQRRKERRGLTSLLVEFLSPFKFFSLSLLSTEKETKMP